VQDPQPGCVTDCPSRTKSCPCIEVVFAKQIERADGFFMMVNMLPGHETGLNYVVEQIEKALA